MSESDGIDDVLDGGVRQSLLIASRIAETIARRVQESARQREHELSQSSFEMRTRMEAERSSAHAVLAPLDRDQWWEKANANDIGTAFAVAEGWKDQDPTALAASEKIRQEVRARYGIDTRVAGTDAASLQSQIHATVTDKLRRDSQALSEEEVRKATIEHNKSAQLLAAARAEEVRVQAEALRPEIERYQVPVEYLSNPALAQALQAAHDADTPEARSAAEAEVNERIFLIGKDGVNGPDIDQLRSEVAANVAGTEDRYFQDPDFVKAAQDLHEAKLLAEGGFSGPGESTVEQRYERAEKDLFSRMEGLGREIESRVNGSESSRLRDQGLKAEIASAVGYGSAERHQAFAESLKNSGATESQVHGRVAAERSEGTHPSTALAKGKGPAKARKSRTGAAIGAERAKNGLSR